jgi:FtsH-binding integral membrane protein
LSRHRARGLLLSFSLAVLLGQQGFLEDPLGVLGFLGLVLIAMGFVADAAAYGSWANRDSPGLPRVSRVLLYVGYVLFAVALVNWALVTHDLADVQLYTGQGALSGFAALGQPLIFLVFLSVITSRPDRVVSAPAMPLPPPPATVGRPPPPPPVSAPRPR